MSVTERWTCADWEAWYNDEPGPEPDRRLHVAAHCAFASGSIKWSLEPTNEGIVDDPDLFVLRLSVDDPGLGTGDFVETTIDWTGDAGQGIKRVAVRGDADVTVDVKRIT
jgi:hypothetical protein